MTHVTDRDWILHYTIGRLLAAKVELGDVVLMPGDGGDLLVLGGRAPLRAKDRGSVLVRDPSAESGQGFEMRPAALGMVWISAVGGWSELPA